MLIPLTDADGRQTWINPILVRVVRTRGKVLGMGGSGTEVWFSFTSNSEAIYFKEPPEQIAAALNAAMPRIVAIADLGDDEETNHPPLAGHTPTY